VAPLVDANRRKIGQRVHTDDGFHDQMFAPATQIVQVTRYCTPKKGFIGKMVAGEEEEEEAN
jgi:hypothetical protein